MIDIYKIKVKIQLTKIELFDILLLDGKFFIFFYKRTLFILSSIKGGVHSIFNSK